MAKAETKVGVEIRLELKSECIFGESMDWGRCGKYGVQVLNLDLPVNENLVALFRGENFFEDVMSPVFDQPGTS
jgi:hypothetical protein